MKSVIVGKKCSPGMAMDIFVDHSVITEVDTGIVSSYSWNNIELS